MKSLDSFLTSFKKRTIDKCIFIIVSLTLIISCSSDTLIEQTFRLAGENKSELEKVLEYYRLSGDNQKYEAAIFLIRNMGNKYGYEGEILCNYEPILDMYDSLFKINILDREPQIIRDKWNELNNKYGVIDISKLRRVYDCQKLPADFLIQNIDNAFMAWRESPFYDPAHFEIFCEYVLPYRIANERPEIYRERYYNELHQILDTVKSAESVLMGFHDEFYKNRKYRSSKVLWDYPVEFSISEMEKAHKGACRHLTTYGALAMRACGLPVTIDRAIWANRSQGHSWNVLLLNDKESLPFDALDKRAIKLAYKPAKIFRKTYSINIDAFKQFKDMDIPKSLFVFDEIDVTNEYVKAFDIEVPIKYEYEEENKKKFGVICVFDNKEWRIVHWGKIKSGKMYFEKMASNVAYIGGYFENGLIIPATSPFLLREDGTIDYCIANEKKLQSMRLERKYPLSELMRNRAYGLVDMTAEGSNNSSFKNPTIFFTQDRRTYNVTDSFVNSSKRFKYVRLHISKTRNGNLAEVEFYGKKDKDSPEEKLTGKIIGFPPKEEKSNSYASAMDGDLETFFIKDKKTEGWVGLELSEPYQITRIRFCPRSDTNFILEGDTYELKYWRGNQWNSAGIKVAEQYNYIDFENVPTETIYLLHNLSRGIEERIFTYENNEQIWW